MRLQDFRKAGWDILAVSETDAGAASVQESEAGLRSLPEPISKVLKESLTSYTSLFSLRLLKYT